MKGDATGLAIGVREYRDEDEQQVLDLMRVALGPGPVGNRTPELFRWKHVDNHFGRSYMLVAESGGAIIGLRAFMRWRFQIGDRVLRAVRAVDTATHPDHQGKGVFSRLTRDAIEALRGEVDLIFNTPNDKSGPGYLKMGWRGVGEIPILIRVRRPLRFAVGLRSLRSSSERPSFDAPLVDAPRAADVLEATAGLEDLLESAGRPAEHMSTPRSVEYLRWRYGAAPHFDYRGVTESDLSGRLTGVGLFRIRSRGALWEAVVDELIVPAGDRRTAKSLIRKIARSSRADHLACSFPSLSDAARAARAAGFLRSPTGMTLVVNPLRNDLEPDPGALLSWGFSLGDLEVF